MRKTRTPGELDSLLGRGGLGATRSDAILETVLAQVKRERLTRSRRRWSLAGLGVAAAAALFLLMPHLLPLPGAAFRAKGTETRPTPAMASTELECLGATLAACPTGSLLIVRVTGVQGFVSAWAEPAGGGGRVWYFSSETVSPRVDATASVGALAPRAIKVGPDHAAGTYRVEVRVTDRPMAREELLLLSDHACLAHGHFSLTVASP